MFVDNEIIDEIVKRAVKEDIWTGDITSDYLIDSGEKCTGSLLAKEKGIIAGLPVAGKVFNYFDSDIDFRTFVDEGDLVKKGQRIALVKGTTVNILKAERTALNFLQRMSGIATRTNRLVSKVAEYPVKIVDTRKTTPTLRVLEKYAVRAGGGFNHRMGLYDAVMIKDNHIKAAGSITKAVKRIRAQLGHTISIEVEVEDMTQLKEALSVKADIIMLDNMTAAKMSNAVDYIDKRAVVEASGGITLETIEETAAAGVDVISIGALTHHIKSLDISLNLQD
ncbi:MAG: carboxylating nicotinate-nucleotide diphosphorylase [Halothermotrichaceae bacterium]